MSREVNEIADLSRVPDEGTGPWLTVTAKHSTTPNMIASQWVLLLTLLVLLLVPLVAWAVTKAECTRTYNSCTDGCRGMADPRLRAACWPACMAAYAGCLAIAK